MRYPTQWRMHRAGSQLHQTNPKLTEVGLDVGDDREAAFSRAFQRVVGVAPGAGRRARGGERMSGGRGLVTASDGPA